MARICTIVNDSDETTIIAEKFDYIVEYIIDFFEKQKLTCGEARCILKEAERKLDDYSLVTREKG